MSGKIVLELNSISKRYRTELALKDISITLFEGEILGFLGPSGAGKTTTIRIITGQLRQTSGEAKILGTDSQNIDASIYEKIGVVSDNSGFYEKLTVQKNLEIFARLLGVPQERITEVLKQTGLYEHRKKAAGKLSRGQAQRLVLARAVLHRPKILFLDEPTSGLDPATAVQIHEMLLALKKEGMAIFLTTHNMEEAALLCDRVALLCQGRIAELDTPEALCIRYNGQKRYRVRLSDPEKSPEGSARLSDPEKSPEGSARLSDPEKSPEGSARLSDPEKSPEGSARLSNPKGSPQNWTEVILSQSPEDAERLAAWLKEDRVLTLHSCEPTLEQVFLQATGWNLNADQRVTAEKSRWKIPYLEGGRAK